MRIVIFEKYPQDWIYRSAGNYANGHSIYDVHLRWADFEAEGGWFFGNTDFPVMD